MLQLRKQFAPGHLQLKPHKKQQNDGIATWLKSSQQQMNGKPNNRYLYRVSYQQGTGIQKRSHIQRANLKGHLVKLKATGGGATIAIV